MMTFCWLPPESEVIGLSARGVLIDIRPIISRTFRPSPARPMCRPRLTIRQSPARVMLLDTDMVWTRPSRCRSSGTREMPLRIRCWMSEPAMLPPSRSTSPVALACRPMMISSTSVRPAPMSPNSPRTSPLRSWKEMPSRVIRPVGDGSLRSFTSRMGSPMACWPPRKTLLASSPIMVRTIQRRSTSAMGLWSMSRPSRSTVMKSPIRISSSMRWEM